MKNINTFLSILVLGGFLVPVGVLAEHKSVVAGKMINSDDSGIVAAHGEVCSFTHYHGELDGVAHPAPDGCGHGQVVTVAHDGGDGETLPVPAPAEKGLWDQFTSWLGSLNREDAKNVIDVAAEANGIPPPGTVSDTVDIVVEATPSIMEKADGIEKYRDSVDPEDDNLGLYRDPAEGLVV